MNTILFTITSVLFFISTVNSLVFWLYFWQQKEYRFDRVWVHLTETTHGRRILINPLTLSKFLFLFVYIFIFLEASSFFVYSLGVFFLFVYSLYLIYVDIVTKRFHLPIFTPKVTFILLLSYTIITFCYFIPPVADKFFWLLILDRFIFFILLFALFLFSLIGEFYLEYLEYKATKKRETLKKLKTIGITGSYGKGSTKEFAASILSSKFSVEKTFENNNTPFAIAKTILKKLNRKTDFFVAEMGAYKKGEIFEMCTMVQPMIGIITSINNQHASLFKNIKTTINTKYELIESLPKNGLALFNGNNEYLLDLYNKTTINKVLYYTDYKNTFDFRKQNSYAIVASNITQDKFFTSFDIFLKNSSLPINFKAPVLGAQNVENLLPGIYLGLHFGIPAAFIKDSVANIALRDRTMFPFVTESKTTLIDDTYNANPQSVLAAVNYMKLYKGKKILVLQPMIELGKKAREIHEDIICKAAEVCNSIIVTNDNYLSAITAGVEKSSHDCGLLVLSASEIVAFVKNLKKNDVVVFEGKEAEIPLSILAKERVQ